MREIIMPNSGKGNSKNSTVEMAHVKARAVKRSNALGSVNQLCLDIDLDSLDEDSIQRSKELYKMLCEKYAEAKRTFEGSNTGIVKNGTYFRKFVLLDPVDGELVIIHIVMQRYKHKKDGHTHTFYGDIFMAYLPFLIRQVLTVLSEREALDTPSLQVYCQSWGITAKLYYGFFHRIWDLLRSKLGGCSRKEFKDYLKRSCYP